MAEPAGEPDHFIVMKDSPGHTAMVLRCMRDLCPAERAGRPAGAEPAGYLVYGGKTGGSRKYTAQDPRLFIRLIPGICSVHVQHAITDVLSLCMTPYMGTERGDCVNRPGDHLDSDVEEPCESGIPARLIREPGYQDIVQTRRSGVS